MTDQDLNAAALVACINRERTARQLAPLEAWPALHELAELQAHHMANLDRTTLQPPTGKQVAYQMVDLARAKGYQAQAIDWAAAVAPTATRAAAGWILSPVMRAQLLEPDLRHIGAAAAMSPTGQVYWSAVFGIPAHTHTATATPEPDALRQRINHARQPGHPLERLSALDAVAQSQADYQAATDTKTHANPAGHVGDRATAAGYRWAWIAENVAQADTFEQVYQQWRTSPGHWRTMTGTQYRHIGLASAQTANDQIYWAAVFGSGQPNGTPPPPPAPPTPPQPEEPAPAPTTSPNPFLLRLRRLLAWLKAHTTTQDRTP